MTDNIVKYHKIVSNYNLSIINSSNDKNWHIISSPSLLLLIHFISNKPLLYLECFNFTNNN